MITHQVQLLSFVVAILTAWSNAIAAESTDIAVRLPTEQPWSLSAHIGRNDPQSSFGNVVGGDVSLGLDLEYRFRQRYAAEIFFGNDSFDGETGIPDIDVLHIALNGKAYFPVGSNEMSVHAGYGIYNFDPGPSEAGINAGVGFESWLSPSLAWGVSLRYHNVDTSGSSTQFYTLHGVVRFTF